jgi:hypothetical protein
LARLANGAVCRSNPSDEDRWLIMVKQRRIAAVATKTRLDEPQSDLAYWLSQPSEARLAALEEIRQEYIRRTFEVPPRMQKVCTIVKLQ